MVPSPDSRRAAPAQRRKHCRGVAAVVLVALAAVIFFSIRRSGEVPVSTTTNAEMPAPGGARTARPLPPPASPAAVVTRTLVDMSPPPGAKSDYPLGVNAAPPPGKVTFSTDHPKRMAFPSVAAASMLPARVRLLEPTEGKYRSLRLEEVWTDRDRTQLIARHTMVGDHLLVSAAEGVDAARLSRALPDTFTIRRALPSGRAFLVAFPVDSDDSLPAARVALENLGPALVKRVEPDTFVHAAAFPNDPLFAEQWGLHNTGQNNGTTDADLDAPEAWDLRTDATDFPIAVIDTGIDYSHPDLDANIWTNVGETGADTNGQDKRTNGLDDDANGYIDDWRGWDFANDDNNPMDDNGHGTQVAGIIGAEGNNGEGITGVCWSCRMMPLKALTSSGSGAWSDIINAVTYARTMKARVGNLSFGAYGAAPEEVKFAFAAANKTLWCAAAGNGELPHNGNQTGDDLDEFHFFPACLDIGHLISVTATARNDELASFANYGRFMVDVAAPGVGIRSTLPDGGYGLSSGTSMASAYVSGFCALAWPLRAQPYPFNVRQLALTTVERSEALRNKLVTRGRLDAGLFLTQAKSRMAWQMIASDSLSHCVQLLPDGRVFAWGSGYPTPVEVPLPADTRSVHAGRDGGYALLSDGSLWRWKSGNAPRALSITDVRFLIAWGDIRLILKTDGALFAGFAPWDGQLDNDFRFRQIPFDRPIVQCAIETCLDDAGRLYSLPHDSPGPPVQYAGLPPLDRFTEATLFSENRHLPPAIVARTAGGEAYGVALFATGSMSRLPEWDGYLNAWAGGAFYGTMPDGRVLIKGLVEPSVTQEVSGLTHLAELAGGDSDEEWDIALDETGRVSRLDHSHWPWGEERPMPIIEVLPQVQAITGLWRTTEVLAGMMLLSADFRAFYHGANHFGFAGLGIEARKSRPVELPSLRGAKHLANGTYVVMQDGSLRMWGAGGGAVSLHYPNGMVHANRLIPTPAGRRIRESALLGERLIMDDGTLWAADGVNYVQLTTQAPAVTFLPGSSCALLADGSVKVEPGQEWRFAGDPAEFKAFDYYGLALKQDGTLWEWKDSAYSSQLAGFSGITQFASIALWGRPIVYALRNDGQVLVQGTAIDFPLLGDGRLNLTLDMPTPVPGLSDIVQIGAVGGCMAALRRDGELFVWGRNSEGQLGIGNTEPYDWITQPLGLSQVVEIWPVNGGMIARRSDGSFWGWGPNTEGGLCDGSVAIDGAPTLAYGYSSTVFNAGNGFTDWLTTYFNEQELRDIELSADAKDPDDDGLSNLLEYALGTNPRKYTAGNTVAYEPVPAPTPTYEITSYVPWARLEKVRRNYYTRGVGIAGESDADEETTHLVMTVPRAARRSDVDYIIEVSDDMEHWHFGTGHTVEVLNTLTSLVVYDARPLEENPTRFIRLRLVRNNPGQTSLPR